MTEPGIYADVPEDAYHSDRTALSCSGAKLLLPPSCPAIFRHQQDNPPESKAEYDLGHAAHKLVLGVGAEIRYITGHDLKGKPSPGWGTKDAAEKKAKAYADGAIPLLESQRATVEAMAAQIRAHPIAGPLFTPGTGDAEHSLYWNDTETGLPLRGRLDWIRHRTNGGRIIIGDYKTSVSASPATIQKSMAEYLYCMQDAFYSNGIRALGIDDDPAFIFVVQSKSAPYIVSVAELDYDGKRIGRQLMSRAIHTYIDCIDAGRWPGYSDEVMQVSLPTWFTYLNDEDAA